AARERRADHARGDLVADAMEALSWRPLRERVTPDQLLHELTLYGLREALALLFDDRPELAAADVFREFVVSSALRISRAYVARRDEVEARLERLRGEQGYLAALAQRDALRWDSPDGDSLPQIRGAIGWRRDVPRGGDA